MSKIVPTFFAIVLLSICLFCSASCSLFKRETDWSSYKNDVNFYFTKVREATLGRVLVKPSFYRDTRTFIHFVQEQTDLLRHKWSIIPNEWSETFLRNCQHAALDQDTSSSAENLAQEQFVADMNRSLLKFIEQLRSLSNPVKGQEDHPRSLFFFWP